VNLGEYKSINEVATALENSVDAASQWLSQLNDETAKFKPTKDRWSIAEVIGHLIDSAANNHQRFIRAQETDELVFPKYDQNSWVTKNAYANAKWPDLVELWRLYNLQLSRVIREIPENELATKCTISPYESCTLGFLVTDYVDHMNHHLSKIRERVD